MQIITATELRTKSKDLFETLEQGKSVSLVKGSRIVAEIKPKKGEVKKVFDAKRFANVVRKLNLPQLTEKERKRRYRKAMEEKHGKFISG